MDKGKKPAEEEINTLEEPSGPLVNAPVWAEIEALRIWERKEGENYLDYQYRMELIYMKSKQVYEKLMNEEMTERTEKGEQQYRGFDRRLGPVEVVGRNGLDIPESSRARTSTIEEAVPVIDPDSVLDVNFDDLDPEEDPEEDSEEDPEEGPEVDLEENVHEEPREIFEVEPLRVVVDPYEDIMGDGYHADEDDIMSDDDSDIIILGGWPVRREDPMSEEESEITMWEESPPEPVLVELSDSVGQLALSDSMSVGTPPASASDSASDSDSDSTSDDDSGDTDFDPDQYMEEQDRFDASPFFA